MNQSNAGMDNKRGKDGHRKFRAQNVYLCRRGCARTLAVIA
jgi:hypothetical protein